MMLDDVLMLLPESLLALGIVVLLLCKTFNVNSNTLSSKRLMKTTTKLSACGYHFDKAAANAPY